jgi:hypothetical protein
MDGEGLLASLRHFHVWLGFATAFALAPLALCARPGGAPHRRAGKLYVACMCVLFASGMVFTFTKHELLTYKWARNVAFNALGFLPLFLGLRALRLESAAGRLVARPLDRALRVALGLLSAATFALGVRKWPLLAIGAAGALLVWLDWRETRPGGGAAAVGRTDRHARYMLASYFYVLTVVSLVYGPAGAELKWVWPLALALPTIALASSPAVRARLGLAPALAQRRATRLTATIGACVAALVALQVARTGVVIPSSQDGGATPRSPAIAAAP